MPTKNEDQSKGSTGSTADAKAESALQEARAAVDRLCKMLGVKKFVIVDDELSAAPEIGDLIARYFKLRGENAKRLEHIKQLDSVVRGGNDDDVREDLEELWKGLDEFRQDDLLIAMGWTPARKTFSLLSDLLSAYDRKFLSFAEWKEQEQELTTPEALAESLLLFDLDMSRESGAEDEGMRIIKSLLTRINGPCQCGLLSHLVAKDTEYQDWQKFTVDYGLQRHQGRFVVISKKHLPESPMLFAQRLKRAAISSPCDELRREVENVLDGAFAEAKVELSKLNVYDFEEVVFQSSHAEGVWEPDTLLRILAMYTQRSARNLLKSNGAVEQIASRIRSVIDIGYRPADAPAPSSRKIMQLENYEDDAFLREHHIPLDLGDIFRSVSGYGEFILLAQPCDIMCRNKEGEKRRNEILVAPIIEKPINDKTFEKSSAYWKLDVYSADEKNAKYADFHAVRAVPILALDLTVFDDEGKSRFSIDKPCPANAIPSWQRRHGEMKNEIGNALARYESAVQTVTDTESGDAAKLINQAVTKSLPNFLLGVLDVPSRMLSYDVERIARLKPPRAASLLRAFTAFLARDGFDHDLTLKVVASEM